MEKKTFSPIAFKQYPNTFLLNVLLRINFTPYHIQDYKERFREFISSFFGLEIETKDIPDYTRLKRGDGSVMFFFTQDYVLVQIDGSQYANFVDTALPQLERMKEYIKKVFGEESSVNGIAIRKINAWDFNGLDGIAARTKFAESKIFSQDLLGILKEKPSAKEGERMSDMKTASVSSEDCVITFNTAYLKNDTEKGAARLILDTECNKDGTKKIADIQEISKNMNKLLFDAYHWCVTKEVIDIMSNEHNDTKQ